MLSKITMHPGSVHHSAMILVDMNESLADLPGTEQLCCTRRAYLRADKTFGQSATGSLGAAAPAHRLPGGPAAKRSCCSEGVAAWSVLWQCAVCGPGLEAV